MNDKFEFESVDEVKEWLKKRFEEPYIPDVSGVVYIYLRDVLTMIDAQTIAYILIQFKTFGELEIDWNGIKDYPDVISVRLKT